MTFPKLQRLYRLSRYLNNNVGIPKTYSDIYRYMIRYEITKFCLSTIEKDIHCLRMDFDYEIQRVHNGRNWTGICLHEEVDFMDRLQNYLQ